MFNTETYVSSWDVNLILFQCLGENRGKNQV